MTSSVVGYEQVRAWVEIMLGRTHATVVRITAWIVLCVLVAQRVTAAALARALPAGQAGSGRARLTRVRRWWTGPPLDQRVVSPQLIQAARMLLPPDQPVVVALDTTRLGPWEVWLAGVVMGGRAIPIGWAVIPYPWPKGRFRTTTVALIQRLQDAFPPNVSWSLVADRGFPSAMLFAHLRQADTAFSVRLNAWVTVESVYATVAEHLEAGRLVVGQRTAAAMGCGRRDQPLVPGWIAVSAAVVVALPTETMVDRLIGVVCLTYGLQMGLGQRLSADPLGQLRRAQWTVTDRVSWFWCGQRLFNDPGYDWRAWLAAQWSVLIDRLVPIMPTPAPSPLVDKAA